METWKRGNVVEELGRKVDIVVADGLFVENRGENVHSEDVVENFLGYEVHSLALIEWIGRSTRWVYSPVPSNPYSFPASSRGCTSANERRKPRGPARMSVTTSVRDQVPRMLITTAS